MVPLLLKTLNRNVDLNGSQILYLRISSFYLLTMTMTFLGDENDKHLSHYSISSVFATDF